MKHMVKGLALCALAVVGLAHVAHAKTADELSAGSYIQAGLVAQWDGIENVGLGEEHDGTATAWVNLVDADNSFALSGKGSFADDAFVCAGGGIAATAAHTVGGVVTMEVVCDHCSADWSVPFYNGSVECYVGMNGSTKSVRCVAGNGSFYSYSPNERMTICRAREAHYVNGEAASVATSSYFDTKGTALTIGARADASYSYAGKIYAIRLYNRELSADEIMKNALVDQVRFFGGADWPTVTVHVSSQEGGLVSVNGGEWAQAVEQTVDFGDEVALAFKSESGATFKYWEVEGGLQRYYSARETTAMAFDGFAATAHLRPAGVTERQADDYQLEGLVAFWDGVENAGLGAAHDDAATVWKDLVGSRDLTLVEGRANFISNALTRTAGSTSGIMAQGTPTCTNYKTIEIACDLGATTYGLLFCGGNDSHLLASRGKSIEPNASAYYAVAVPGTYAFVYGTDGSVTFYIDGEPSVSRSAGEKWVVAEALYLGAYTPSNGNYPFLGNYHSLRLYDRALTPTELYANAKVDGARYFGRPIDEGMQVNVRGGGVVSADGGEAAAVLTLTPALGDVIHLEATPAAGWSFVAWETSDGALYSTNAVSPVIDYEMNAYCTLTAVFVETSELSDTDVTNYIYDGLLGLWDGIANAGHGNVHDSAATVWKDLVSSADATLAAGEAAFGERSLECSSGANKSGARLPHWYENAKTLEVVCERKSPGYPFVPGNGSYVGFEESRIIGFNGGERWVGATNLATYTFVWEGDVPCFYENGRRLFSFSGFNTWAAPGGNALIGYYSFVGKIYSIRVYDRVLSVDEIWHNANLDQRRFFDAAPVCGQREFRIRVATEGDGRVAVTGGAKVGENEYLVREGGAFALEARPRTGRVLTGWRATSGAYVDRANVLSGRLELMAVADAEIVASFGLRETFASPKAEGYVRDGLVAQWDGIENAGLGLAHDPASAVWKDLAGTRDLPLADGRGSFAETALVCAGGGYAAGPADALTSFRTIEVVCEGSTAQDSIVFDGGAASRCLSVNPDKTFYMGSGTLYRHFGSPTTLVWRDGPGYAADGVPAQHVRKTSSWTVSSPMLYVGGRNAAGYSFYPYTGKIHAIRVYDRVLTDAELAHNFLLDGIRFFGRRRPSVSGFVMWVR